MPGFVYQIHIKSAGNQLALGDFTLDLKHGSGFLRPGMDSQADMFLSINDDDLVAMSQGKLSTFNALRDGRLTIKGPRRRGWLEVVMAENQTKIGCFCWPPFLNMFEPKNESDLF